jgi:fatty acid desaturase
MQEYAREVREYLPASVFERAPARLLWLIPHLGIIVASAWVVVRAHPPWYVALLCALLAGHSWGCLGFLAHETMHHATVRSRAVEHLVATIGLLPYCLSPTLWSAWHNQAHHGKTGHLIGDPDAFGTLNLWRRSAHVRHMETLSAGSGYARSALFLPLWFSLQILIVLLVHSERKQFYARISRRAVYLETGAMALFWIGVLAAVGPWCFLFVYLVPLLAANTVLMSYIATNHFLNPLTSTNDPLVNSLSVTAPRWIEALHLNFGYHVEHHIFPTVSARHAPAVRDVLVRLYGTSYLSMPHARALRLLYARPKLHRDSDTVINPRTMAVFRTLAPGDLSMPSVSAEGTGAGTP